MKKFLAGMAVAYVTVGVASTIGLRAVERQTDAFLRNYKKSYSPYGTRHLITEQQVAKEAFARYLVNTCPTCGESVGELCASEGVWVHVERMRLVADKKS